MSAFERKFPKGMKELERLFRVLEYRDRSAQPGSVRLQREAERPGRRVYYCADSLLVAAWDALDALHQVTEIRPIAHYALIRAAFDTALHAVWILMPDDPAEREYRAIQFTYDSLNRELNTRMPLFERMGGSMEARGAQEKILKSHLHALTADAEKLSRYGSIKMVSTTQITKHVGAREAEPNADFLQLCWGWLSALIHGDMGVLSVVSDKHTLRELPGGSEQLITVGDEWFDTFASTAALLVIDALHLLMDQSGIEYRGI